MAVQIRQAFIPTSKYYIKVPSESIGRTTYKWVTIHNTANDASAANEVSYMSNNYASTSFHAAVDDKEVLQAIPTSCGAFDTSNRDYAVNGYSIEICYSLSGGSKFIAAEKNAAWYAAYMLKAAGLPVNNSTLRTHQQATGKYCPHRTLDMGWNRFVQMVVNEYNAMGGNPGAGGEEVTQEQFEKMFDKMVENKAAKDGQKWSSDARSWAHLNGIFKGDEDGFRWRDYISREEIAQVFYNLMRKGMLGG